MRILVVEDEKKIADFIRRGLREEDHAVDVATDGEQGHFMATTEDYDLIVLDLVIPKMDGLSLCRKLREEGETAPILMLTVKDSVADKVRGLDAGADDYLAKPFAFEEFLARVRALLRKRDGGRPATLRVSDLEIDLVAHKVTRAGRPVSLTPKEFSLLEYLVRNAGTVVSRTMIAEHVWDINFDPFTNIIDVYVSYLRKKIDRGHDHPLIRTVRGRGYELAA
jgi:two-component system copper resistance phosphate regulon response regulator CusR